MADTHQLIQQLSKQATPVQALRPLRHAVFLLAVLCLYAICALYLKEGVRADLMQQFTRPFFITEVMLLLSMLISAAVAAVYAMLPDTAHQKWRMRLPYLCACAMAILVVAQCFLPHDGRMVMPVAPSHTVECTLYIAASSLLPTMLIFVLIRKGASVMPMQAGALAVIASVSVGALTLRLTEANDEIMHVLMWHYAPSIICACFGALLGRYLLRW